MEKKGFKQIKAKLISMIKNMGKRILKKIEHSTIETRGYSLNSVKIQTISVKYANMSI